MAAPSIIITIVLAAVGAILAAALLVVFAMSYRRVRAPFTLSLILVAAFFLAQNALSIYAFVTMMAHLSDLVMNFMVIITAFGDIALGVLLYTSSK